MEEKKVLHIFTFTLSDNANKIVHESMQVSVHDDGWIYEIVEEGNKGNYSIIEYLRPIGVNIASGEVEIYYMFPTNKIDRVQIRTFEDTIDVERFKEPFIKQLTEEIAERKKQLALVKKLSL